MIYGNLSILFNFHIMPRTWTGDREKSTRLRPRTWRGLTLLALNRQIALHWVEHIMPSMMYRQGEIHTAQASYKDRMLLIMYNASRKRVCS